MAPLTSCLPLWEPSKSPPPSDSTTENEVRTEKIEDYRAGYPRFTALISSHSNFFVFRRFDKLRARLLLLKQDRLSILEKSLDDVDHSETAPIFLGRSRCDRNAERASLLREIDDGLADYDRFVERSNRVMSFGSAQMRDVGSLQNWLNSSGCLDREEGAYLTHHRDLFALSPIGDDAVLKFESWVEDKLIRFHSGFRNSRFHDVSTDKDVFIYSGSLIKRTAKGLLVLLISFILMMPIIICNVIGSVAIRVFVVMACTICYLLVLSELTKSKTMELIVAGTTYATVLIVFVSGTSGI
ncbi:hypothetical protein EDB80DRAFT_704407 [Ilyonectria destructans]|nr:hypothetical protein EDB80DRAFT_704407 [Ilyonectria destructans]